MYSDKNEKNRVWLWRALALAALVALIWGFIRLGSGQESRENGAAAIRETVEAGARQCYVVEGVYPPDLDYLENNYGLKINREDFYVTYDTFASNLPPDVIVTPKVTRSEAGDMD